MWGAMVERGLSSIIVIVIVVAVAAVTAIGGYYLARVKHTPENASVKISENEAVNIAIAGLENNKLYVNEPYAHLLENTTPSNPIFVESIDNRSQKVPSYYLVPFVRNGRIFVIVEVNAEVGEFAAAFDGSENGLDKYPFVSSDEALEIVRKAIENVGPLENPKLVWKPCEQSWEPVYPFWAVKADGKTVYVGQDGQLYEELTWGGLFGG
jgi:hypothetical protein